MDRYDYLLNLRNASTALLSGDTTAVELCSLSIERIRRHASSNVFISVDETNALKQAAQYDASSPEQKQALPLGGIPIAVKDNIHVAGLPNTAGTPALHAFTPTDDASCVAALREAGAIIIGKTHLHELALGVSGYNSAFNTGELIGTRNARNISHIAGGSSSGSAVAVAGMMVPLALGTDTAGSIRLPAALNGCVGYRPSIGRYSTEGITPVSPTRDTLGPLASNVVDVVQIDALLRPHPSTPASFKGPLRLGVVNEFWSSCSSEILAACQAALVRIEKAGIQLVDVSLKQVSKLAPQCGSAIVLHEQLTALTQYLRAYDLNLSYADIQEKIASPDIRKLVNRLIAPQLIPNAAGELSDSAPLYQEAIQQWCPAMLNDYQTVSAQHELHGFIFPTVTHLAPLATQESSNAAHFSQLAANVNPGSCVGLAGISLPVAVGSHNLAIGMEIDVLPGKDELLFIIASKVEQALGFSKGFD